MDLLDVIHLKKLRDNWQQVIKTEGGRCPCCDRWGKIYLRNINSSMARALIWLCQEPVNQFGWIDIPKSAPRWLVQTNQLPTLRWWGLVERAGNEDKKVKHSGLWRPTDLGRDFFQGITSVPKGVLTYDATVVAFTDEQVFIHECFDEKFSYQKVMNETLASYQTDEA